MIKKENSLSYRKLRDPKRGKTGTVSPSLLASIFSKKGQRSSHKDQIMGKNVNQYQHAILNPQLKENYIRWMIGLRCEEESNRNRETSNSDCVPEVFSKTTKSQLCREKQRKTCKIINEAAFDYIIGRKKASKFPLNSSVVNFMTSLRERSSKSMRNTHNFSTIPFKERNHVPKFIKKEYILKGKSLKEIQQQSAFDGNQQYPTFNQKIVKQRNYGLTQAFVRGKNKASLPNLAWQMGLRYAR